MGLLTRLFGRDKNAARDSEMLYQSLLAQSRQPEFFGKDRQPDSYEGRIDVLSMHVGLVLRRLRQLGEQGERLAQALFDTMVDDFDIALREESLTDKAVSRRIKPIIELFYARVKIYDAYADGSETEIQPVAETEFSSEFSRKYSQYVKAFSEYLANLELPDLALASIQYPKIS